MFFVVTSFKLLCDVTSGDMFLGEFPDKILEVGEEQSVICDDCEDIRLKRGDWAAVRKIKLCVKKNIIIRMIIKLFKTLQNQALLKLENQNKNGYQTIFFLI